jgi:energy-coupling factor transport system permease protein
VNPRALLVWAAVGVTIAAASSNPAPRAAVLIAAAAVLAARRRPGARILPLTAGVTSMALLAALLSFAQAHLGDHAVFALPFWVPGLGGPWTLEALAYGSFQGLGLAAIVVSVSVLAACLEAHQLIDALPGWLQRTGLVVASALNLIPGLARSFTAVADAQRMRGWRPRGIRSWSEVLVPVVLTAIEDSMQLAEAMEARGFGSGPRSRYSVSLWAPGDALAAGAAATALVVYVVSALLGLMPAWHPYPTLSPPIVSPVVPVLLLLLLVPALPQWRPRFSIA